MLQWVLIFFILALIAGLLGFSRIAVGAMDIARILFFIFLILLLISLLMHFLGGAAVVASVFM